jgi:hypothetical protein
MTSPTTANDPDITPDLLVELLQEHSSEFGFSRWLLAQTVAAIRHQARPSLWSLDMEAAHQELVGYLTEASRNIVGHQPLLSSRLKEAVLELQALAEIVRGDCPPPGNCPRTLSAPPGEVACDPV